MSKVKKQKGRKITTEDGVKLDTVTDSLADIQKAISSTSGLPEYSVGLGLGDLGSSFDDTSAATPVTDMPPKQPSVAEQESQETLKKIREEIHRKQIEELPDKVQRLEWSISSMERSITSLREYVESRKLSNRIKAFGGRIKSKWKGFWEKVYKKTEKIRIRNRRHFYKIRLEKFDFEDEVLSMNLGVQNLVKEKTFMKAKVVFKCEPNWLGKKLGYPVTRQGYRGNLKEGWTKIPYYVYDPVSPYMVATLDKIYKERIALR